MKQFYCSDNCASHLDNANAATRQSSFSCSVPKIFSLLLGILLLIPVLGYGIDRKPEERVHWCDCDDFWTVSYNLSQGSIDLHLLYYDHKAGGGLTPNVDGWLNGITLSYSTDGAFFTGFYEFDWDGSPQTFKYARPISADSTEITITNNEGDTHHYLDIRLNLTTALQQIKKIRIEGKWAVNAMSDDDILATKDITITQMTSLNLVSPYAYSFETLPSGDTSVAKARLSFWKSAPLSEVDNLSIIKLYKSDGTYIGDTTVATNGSYYVPLSNTERTFYFVQSAYGGRITTQSGNVTVPAFTLPKSASATYDTTNHRITFSWTMDAATGSTPVNDQFKLQIDNNQYFNSPAYATVGYVAGQTSYSYTYTIDENFAPTMYFRVARDHTQFNWELAKTASLAITFNSITAGTAKVVLQNNNTAHITWLATHAAWLPGSTLIIRRTNNTTNAQTDFRIDNETEYNRGYYDDQQIAICNQYTYNLQLQPPANFTAYAAIQLGSVLPSQTGIISNFVVSKGYFPDRTELTWRAQGSFETFIVKRAIYGTGNYIQLATVPGASNSSVAIDDSKGTPGVYYTYMVLGTSTCNNQTVYSQDTLYAVGFRSPTGNIYGRITYENGQAVENVQVRLQSNDQAQLGQSILLNGNTSSYLVLDSLISPFEDSALTVEAWIRPTDAAPVSQTLFSRGGQYELGFDAAGKLYFTYNGTGTVIGNYTNTNQVFVHIAGIHRKDSLFLLLNGSMIGKAGLTYAASTPEKPVYIGRRAAGGNNYRGLIDEIRVWNVALSSATVTRDHTRLLAGNEHGLVAYWRLDETIVNQFYDASYHGDRYNQNDGSMNSQQVQHNKTVPTSEQLGLRDFTDASGNYIITGIPFVGNGTTYTVAPLLGTHQFEPSSANRLISTYSPVFTVDFKDKSSFPVSGYVYYKNSTVPVSGVQFKIDGQLAQQSNGTIIESDVEGVFAISVPVGVHEVQAVKNNHVFVNLGKITDRGHNLNYQEPLAELKLYDSTTVRFIGRLAGGPIQEALPLGHSVSVNNLGKELSIIMKLQSQDKYQLYSGTADSMVTNNHLLPSSQKAASGIHKSSVVYDIEPNQIVIYPDSVTGEFIADLIPEKFSVISVNATGWGNMIDNSIAMDLTDKFSVQNSIRSYTDSVQNEKQVWIKTDYRDTVVYNTSYKFIKRITPSVSIDQLDFGGDPVTYFGNATYPIVTFSGVQETVNVIDDTQTGKDIYIYGAPIFNQNQRYTFQIKAFEAYPFYEAVVDDQPVIRLKDSKEVIDNVPTRDGFVSIYNSLRNGPTTADTLSLNHEGLGFYEFTAGDPDLTSDGRKDFGATIRFGQATDVDWKWNGDDQLSAYVMGGKLTGTDFVTAGPDKLLFVLRDPPGSKSFSFVEKGSVITTSSKYTGSLKQSGELELTQKLGAELVTFTGIGVGTINSATTSTGIGVGVTHEEHYTGSDTKENTTTLTTNFKTSDDPLFVGPPGDVFVGYSTNITYGQSNNITIVKRSEYKPAGGDVLIFEPDAASPYLVVKRGGINIGQVFGTLFAYPQQHIENILIPHLLEIRNGQLQSSTMTDAEAQLSADNNNIIVYVSKLLAGDSRFGKSNSDTTVFFEAAKTASFADGPSYKIFFPTGSTYRTDTILILNQYVESWKKRMADNEKAKLEAVLQQNYSFHSGAPIEHSIETSVKTEHEDEFSFVIGGSVSNSTDVNILGSGFEFKFKEALSTEHGGTFGSSTDNTVKYGFTLASEGTDDYFSVDVSVAKDSAFVFRTKGGSSGCPYAGKTETKYYQPGTVFDQPTVRNQVPVITVDKPVASNVPSSRKASFTLYLKNESEAKLSQTYVLDYVNNDKIQGATICVDGASIANGRAIPIQYGEIIEKVITIEKGPDTMDYNDIMILWHSDCQYDPTGYQENIADTVLLSAHFIPSCSDIAIKSPKDKWVLNTESPIEQGRRYLPVVIDQFDVNNSLFDHIELQFKPSATSTWTTSMKFYYDQTKFDLAEGEKYLISNPAAISYNLVMDDASFNDQRYDVQAVSYCKLGEASYVTTESNLVSGIKDTYSPRLFGSPQPANGILTVNDDIRLTFNEIIAAGLLTNANFQVTGIRNGAPASHSVSVKLNGSPDYMGTEFEKSFTGKNITAEMWILPSVTANQTIFSHGDMNGSLELALTNDNRLKVTVGNQEIISAESFANSPTYNPGNWAHVALVYNDYSRTVSAYYNFVQYINAANVSAYTGTGFIEYGRSIKKKDNYFKGKIHEARIWNDTLNSVKLQLNSLKVLSGAENTLLAYYPMNEGKGTVVLDKAHGSNASLNGLWSTPPSKAITLNGDSYVTINTSSTPVDSSMDYTLELWFKADGSQTNSILASNGKGDGTDPTGGLDLFSLGFEGGLLTFQNNGFKVQADGNYLDNSWHQVAIAVNRNSGSGQLSVDGKLNQFFDAQNLGGIAAAHIYLGALAYFTEENGATQVFERNFKGNLDEFRIWDSYLDPGFISKYNNVRLQGNEIGLLTYYPFDTYVTSQMGVTQVYFSTKDAKVQQSPPDAVVPSGAESDDTAPIKDRGPVENLRFDFVVNSDALIINLLEPKQVIEKSTVTFKAERIRDLNGNLMVSPVTWTAYIDQNLVKWSDKEINLVKVFDEPLNFTSYLVNNGGNSQHYTLSNLPAWLKASPSSGSVDPNSNQKIQFTVNEWLNIGSYEEVIFMRNDNNETEALKVTLKVKGKQPDWVVKPSDYTYNMIVYGKIRMDSVYSTNEEDMLGAFLNGKCIGVTNNTYNASDHLWYTFLTIYSNEVSNSNIEFRIWQAKTGKTFIATPSRAISFANNAIVGTVRTPVIFDGSTLYYRYVALNNNWSWISFSLVIPKNTSLNTTLQNGIWTASDLIKYEGGSGTFSNWTAAAGWTGTLKALDNLSLYKMKVVNAQTLPVNGIAVDVKTTAIPLKGNSWSYISYLLQFNCSLKEALAGYQPSEEDVIKSQTGFAMYNASNGWIGSLTHLEPGKGYMLFRKRTTDTTFKYPTITGSVLGIREGQGTTNTDQRPVPANFNYADNMTIIAVVGPGFDFRNGDSILAFSNGALVGKAKPIQNPLINRNTWFFTIGGDVEQAIVFTVERDGEMIAQSSTVIRYNANSIAGTLSKPLELQFVKQADLIQANPNPFNQSTIITVDLSGLTGTQQMQLSVFDVAGTEVWTMPVVNLPASKYTTTWNGTNSSGSMCTNGVYFVRVRVNGVTHICKVIKQ